MEGQLELLLKLRDGAIGTDSVIAALLDATIELWRNQMPSEEYQGKPKWSPLENGWIWSYSHQKPIEYIMVEWKECVVDLAEICNSEKECRSKHMLLRSVSRLDSLVKHVAFETGEDNYFFMGGGDNYYPAVDTGGVWFAQRSHSYNPTLTCNTKSVVERVCKMLNSGEAEL